MFPRDMRQCRGTMARQAEPAQRFAAAAWPHIARARQGGKHLGAREPDVCRQDERADGLSGLFLQDEAALAIFEAAQA
jgi:hypothetical protein